MLARLRKDIEAVKQRDPACPSTLSALMHYPGLKAVRWHRRTHWLHQRGMVFIARSISQWVRHRTGIETRPLPTRHTRSPRQRLSSTLRDDALVRGHHAGNGPLG